MLPDPACLVQGTQAAPPADRRSGAELAPAAGYAAWAVRVKGARPGGRAVAAAGEAEAACFAWGAERHPRRVQRRVVRAPAPPVQGRSSIGLAGPAGRPDFRVGLARRAGP